MYQGRAEGSLGGFVELVAGGGEVENVDGGFAFGIDERDFDVAARSRRS